MLIAEQNININTLVVRKTGVDVKDQQNMYFFIFEKDKEKAKVNGKVHYMKNKKEAIHWLRKLSLHKDSGVLIKYEDNDITFYYIDPKKQLTFLRALIAHQKTREMARKVITKHNTTEKGYIMATDVKNIYSTLKKIPGCTVREEYISLYGEKILWKNPLSPVAVKWIQTKRAH